MEVPVSELSFGLWIFDSGGDKQMIDMEEGKVLEGGRVASINYSRDYSQKDKSYIDEIQSKNNSTFPHVNWCGSVEGQNATLPLKGYWQEIWAYHWGLGFEANQAGSKILTNTL